MLSSGVKKFWKCTNCGHKSNSIDEKTGPSKVCEECGTRNPNASWKCKSCKTENFSKAKACKECGATAPHLAKEQGGSSSDDTAGSSEDDESGDPMDTCPDCKEETLGENFCTECGYRRDQDEGNVAPNQVTLKNRKGWNR